MNSIASLERDVSQIEEFIWCERFQVLLQDDGFFNLVDEFAKMNRAKRVYCVSKPENKLKGLQVSAAISSIAGCLFHHFRENIMLC